MMKIDGADFVGENLNAMGEALGFLLAFKIVRWL